MGIFEIEPIEIPTKYESIFKGEIKQYLKDELVIKQGSLCSSIMIINSGSIKEIVEYGNNISYAKQHNCNEILGLNIIFSNNPFFDYSFYSETITTVTFISKDNLYNLIKSDDIFLLKILKYISDENYKLSLISEMLRYNPYKRICFYLYCEYKSYNNSSFIIKYTREKLSFLLNLNKNELSLVFKQLTKKNIIRINNKLFTITNIHLLINEIGSS